MLKVKHAPEQLLDVTLIPVLFTLMFTYLFGGAIAGSTRQYLQFLLPGILVMSVLFTTVYSGVALNTDMTSFGLAWVFTTAGLLMRTPSAVMNGGFMALFPLTFLSNVFVEPETLPGWLEAFVDVNPISHLVTASRGLMDGTAVAGETGVVLAAAAALTAVFAPLTTRLYRKG